MKKILIGLLVLGGLESGLQAKTLYQLFSVAASANTSSQSAATPVSNAEIVQKIESGDMPFATYFNKNNINNVILKNNSDGQPLKYSAFIVAAAHNKPVIMTILYAVDNDVIHNLTAGGGTPVAEAARYNSIHALGWFKDNLDKNSKYNLQYYLNKKDSKGHTPLDEAKEAGSSAAVKWIESNS